MVSFPTNTPMTDIHITPEQCNINNSSTASVISIYIFVWVMLLINEFYFFVFQIRLHSTIRT